MGVSSPEGKRPTAMGSEPDLDRCYLQGRAPTLSRPIQLLAEPSRRAPGPPAIVRTQGARRMIVPPIVVQRSAVGMERIEEAVLRFVPFTHHEQVDLSFRVVEEFATTDGHLAIIPLEVRTAVPAYQAPLEVLEDFVCVLERQGRKGRLVDIVPSVIHADASHPGAIPSDPPPA